VTVTLSHVVPVLASPDVEATLAFCEEKLGFHRQWTEGTPPTDAAARRDGAGLIFFLDPDIAERARGVTAIIFLSGVEELYAEHQERGAPIILPINDNDGLRSYVVELPPGYRLRFAEGLELIAAREGTR
jgi:catechol 2,3-dioxygenase-like lactoylglutathione lyase family enzyme